MIFFEHRIYIKCTMCRYWYMVHHTTAIIGDTANDFYCHTQKLMLTCILIALPKLGYGMDYPAVLSNLITLTYFKQHINFIFTNLCDLCCTIYTPHGGFCSVKKINNYVTYKLNSNLKLYIFSLHVVKL